MKKILLFTALENELRETPKVDGFEVINIITGIGKVSSAINAITNIQNHLEDVFYVINVGTAGSSIKNSGDIVYCNKFKERELIILDKIYNDEIIEFDLKLNLTNELLCCTSSDVFVTEGHYEVVDMETFAIAKVCKMYNKPFVSIKYITDNINNNSESDWTTNLNKSSDMLFEELNELLISLKKLDDTI